MSAEIRKGIPRVQSSNETKYAVRLQVGREKAQVQAPRRTAVSVSWRLVRVRRPAQSLLLQRRKPALRSRTGVEQSQLRNNEELSLLTAAEKCL